MNALTSPLLTDLYQLTMLEAYLSEGMEETAAFEFYVRDLPAGRGFLVASGLDSLLSFLEDLSFSAAAGTKIILDIGDDETVFHAFPIPSLPVRRSSQSTVTSKIFVTFVPLSSSTAAPKRMAPFWSGCILQVIFPDCLSIVMPGTWGASRL